MPTDPDALMIFAAGFGTRMGGLTAERPKPLLELGGATLLDRAIATAHGAGIGRIVVNAHYHADQVAGAVAPHGIAVSHEAPDILETGGGLRQAHPMLGADVAYTLNPDAVFLGPNPLLALREAWRNIDTGALLLLVPPKAAHMRNGGGDFVLGPGGALTRPGPMIYTGAQIVDMRGLEDIEETAFSINLYWNRLAAEGRLHGVVYDGDWCDVGTPAALDRAEALLPGSPDD
ncbi:MAG: nucleotidyltransferase family protein [Paracoccaceae bacterium]|nr:nucleotidyltransferase family protein [Paracoccaceae bacterium]